MAGTAGIIASGHEGTSQAGAELLAAGGNAFDAALAAVCASCVCEPLLTSLGGGGFLLAHPAGEEPVVFDFFAQTPATKKPASEIDFYPILADFGIATQEFHIGMGSMAVPGMVAGLFAVHKRFCKMDMAEIMAPAIRMARDGVTVSPLQHYISTILAAILKARPGAMQLVANDDLPGELAEPGTVVRNPELAATFEALAMEGPDLFYKGALATRLACDSHQQGGLIDLKDLADYRVIERKPMIVEGHGGRFAFNAPPSPGGTLLAHTLALLDEVDLQAVDWGSEKHCLAVAHAMQATQLLRREKGIGTGLERSLAEGVLQPDQLQSWRNEHLPHSIFSRGTTHQSVVDEDGNMSSLTSSNGEGCAYVLPGSGIMMNNMLGEEDLNPDGFHRWPPAQRLASMMCPTVAERSDGSRLALGSGGSNRIRSAVLQVLINLFDFDMPLDQAVMAPRLHMEQGFLNIEGGYADKTLDSLKGHWSEHQVWEQQNMFFGGVHAVARLPDGQFRGAGDPRRGGCVAQNS